MRITEAFICSLPPHACLTLFPLIAPCIAHLSESHPEHLPLIRSEGLVGLQKIPIAITLSPAPAAVAGTLVYACDHCRCLFPSRASASDHWTTAAVHRTVAIRTLREEGESGCRRGIDSMERIMSIVAQAENHGIDPLPAEIPPPHQAPPPPLRVVMGRAFHNRSVRLFLTATTIAELVVQLEAAWGGGGGGGPAMPLWHVLLAAGPVVQMDLHDGRHGECVLVGDRSVAKMKERMAFGVVRFGGE